MATRAKGNYETLVRSAVTHTTVLTVEPFPTQGFSSTTYSVELGDQTSIVVQVRPSGRPLTLSNFDDAHSIFGTLVPSGSLLVSDKQLLLYMMSRIPGKGLNYYLDATDCIPSIAASLGTILARAIVPEAKVSALINRHGGEKSHGLALLEVQLELASQSQTDVESLCALKPIFVSLLNLLRSNPELRCLPLTMSNGDISPTNIVIQDNAVSGIVDWEDIELMPLGYNTEVIFWLTGIVNPRDGSHSPHPNAEEIERSFWSAFSTSLPTNLRSQHAAIELALHIAGAVRACTCGQFNQPWAGSLRTMTEYRIPLQYWTLA